MAHYISSSTLILLKNKMISNIFTLSKDVSRSYEPRSNYEDEASFFRDLN